jgi:hypothetical protein
VVDDLVLMMAAVGAFPIYEPPAESQPKSVPADQAPFVEIVQAAVSTGSDPDKLTAGERSGATTG